MADIIGFFRGHSSRDDGFIEAVRPHIGAMYRMAYKWTQNREDAEDLVQETLIKLVSRVDEMEKKEKLGPWLIKVLYHVFVDFYRKRARSPAQDGSEWRGDVSLIDELILKEPDRGSGAGPLESQKDLIKALGTLNGDQRDVVLLHDSEGYSAVEVAEILDISIGTVKSRLHRARRQLKDFLE